MASGPVRRPPHELAFAAAIRAACIQDGRTQADVAAAAGLSVRVLQRAERGLRRLSIGQAAAIAQALGRSADELEKVSESATFGRHRWASPAEPRCERVQPELVNSEAAGDRAQ